MSSVAAAKSLGRQRPSSEKKTRVRLLVGMSVFAIIWLIPIIWTVVLSLRPENSIQANLTRLVPVPFTTEHWHFVFSDGRIAQWFVNSLVVSTARTLLQIVVCSLAAYSFARIPFPGRKLVFLFALVGLMVPAQAVFVPLYLLFSDLKLLNTYTALVIPGVASSFAIFLLTQFFRNIPIELEEAAMLDGASRLGVYFRIILPLSIPVLTSLAIFTYLSTWNEYLWPLVVATDPDIMTITIGLRNLTATVQRTEYGQTMASAWAAGLPIIVFFLIFQKRIISGIQVSSGIKS